MSSCAVGAPFAVLVAEHPLEKHEAPARDLLEEIAARQVRMPPEADPHAHFVLELRPARGIGERFAPEGLERVGRIPLPVQTQLHLTHATGLDRVHEIAVTDSIAFPD